MSVYVYTCVEGAVCMSDNNGDVAGVGHIS